MAMIVIIKTIPLITILDYSNNAIIYLTLGLITAQFLSMSKQTKQHVRSVGGLKMKHL